ncbi:MAG TPA: substrate-binding domain-containing protein [Polyangiaceae bacterium]
MGSFATPASGAFAILGQPSLDDHSLRIVRTLSELLASRNHHTVYFAGGFPGAPMFQDERGGPSLPTGMQAFAVLGEAMRGHEAACAGAFERASAPLVTVGGQSNVTPKVSTIDEMGILQCVGHLVRHHGRRNIAFLAGPEDSVDTRRRLIAYRSAVESMGLTPDPLLIVRSAVGIGAGRDAVLELRRRNGRGIDAVVAASDLLAVGAIEGLREVGVSVPDAVSVIGFGDVMDTAFSSPTITTIRPPWEYYARAVLEELLAKERRGAPKLAPEWEVPSAVSMAMAIRQSCGCKSASQGWTPERERVEEALRRLMDRHLRSRRRHIELFATTQRLLEAENQLDVARQLSVLLETLPFRRLLVCLYAAQGRELRAVFDSEGDKVTYRSPPTRVPIERILPAGMFERKAPCLLYVAPLEFGGEPLGYLAIEADFSDAQECCVQLDLPRSLSIALSRIRLGRELTRLYELERQFTLLRAGRELEEDAVRDPESSGRMPASPRRGGAPT